MKAKHPATIIGLVIAFIGLITYQSLYLALIFMLPLGAVVEAIFTHFFENYALAAFFSALTFATIIAVVSWLYLRGLRSEIAIHHRPSIIRLLAFFGVLLFTFHPMVFYLYAMSVAEQAGDGQFMFNAMLTFPFSSFLFAPIGAAIDFYIRKLRQKNPA